jgi:hypothetical protein
MIDRYLVRKLKIILPGIKVRTAGMYEGVTPSQYIQSWIANFFSGGLQPTDYLKGIVPELDIDPIEKIVMNSAHATEVDEAHNLFGINMGTEWLSFMRGVFKGFKVFLQNQKANPKNMDDVALINAFVSYLQNKVIPAQKRSQIKQALQRIISKYIKTLEALKKNESNQKLHQFYDIAVVQYRKVDVDRIFSIYYDLSHLLDYIQDNPSEIRNLMAL